MRIDSLVPNDESYHEYCLYCRAEAVEWTVVDGRRKCVCHACGERADRAVIIDPGISWWLGRNGEYWHESSGVFVRDALHRFLFFQRRAFPFAMTVPAGHVDRGESPAAAAVRELGEEVGIPGAGVRHIASDPLLGDGCRRGSDAHLWHAYLLEVAAAPEVTVNEEGGAPVWLTLDEARSRHLTYAVRHVIDRHAAALTAEHPQRADR
ncbi:NUDIX hydrolase [Streptomyces sp. SL13]|uniref:NUDIX hydrolase n=1 Tax=Streptantibioticus silvisoli TaxID=2705255 RepID=A0AA90H2T0_9ACTN|nr:NUDIX hydrolase [Streptantibioticus silvisoli]MDI5967820.1 NUDIX hydrolase [Streptantibioticus silvisoli]